MALYREQRSNHREFNPRIIRPYTVFTVYRLHIFSLRNACVLRYQSIVYVNMRARRSRHELKNHMHVLCVVCIYSSI